MCAIVREVVASNPAWEFEQTEEHCCWARLHDWFVHFSWGVDDLGLSEFKSYLVSEQFKTAYDFGVNEHIRQAAILSCPDCLEITGRLLDDIEAADDARFKQRIADLLLILQGKEDDGLARTWANERATLLKNLQYIHQYVRIPWMNDDGSLAAE